MQHPQNPSMDGRPADEAMMLNQLRATFDNLPFDIPIILFTHRWEDDVFTQATRKVIRAFRDLTDKITLKEFPLDHEKAIEYGVRHAPTMVIAPDRYNIHWLGAPMGEEARSFLETLIFVGLGQSGVNENSAKVLSKLSEKRRVKVFVSSSCPYCPQQIVNAVRAAIEKPDLVSLEIIDIQAFPDLANKYEAHSVPQAYADDMLIAQGAQPEELFMLSMEQLDQKTLFIPDSDAPLVETDLVVIGGGPAGLTAGIYAVRAGLNTAIVEKGALGGQVATTPVVENYPGFTSVGGKTLVDIMVAHALEYVNIFQGEEVIEILPGEPIEVKTSRRTFKTKSVLLATGATHKHLGVPGEERLSGRGVSYCSTCDGPLFKGKRAIMVGGGNSAVTEALYLHHMGVDVTLVHRRDSLRAQEHLVQNMESAGIPVLWNTEVKEILGEARVEQVLLVNNQTGETSAMPVNAVFVAIGYNPAVELAKKSGIEVTEEGYIKRDDRHRTNIPGIYSAGDVEGGYKQIVTAAGQGSEAAISIFEDIINPYYRQKADAARAASAPVS